MNNIAVALFVIAFEIAVVAVVLVVGFFMFARSTKSTLEETQKLVQSLEERVNELGDEFKESLKNANEATAHLKKTLSNTEKATAFVNAALPVLSGILLWKGINLPAPVVFQNTKETRKSASLMSNLGKLLGLAGEGYMIYKKYFAKSKGGNKNGRK